MIKKILLVLVIYIVSNLTCFGQEYKTVLSSPDNWKQEIIPFPIGFAQSIDLVGFEDLRFAPDWSDVTNENFWTYTFVWYVEQSEPMTESKLTAYFNSYYDGLMEVNLKNPDGTINPNKLDNSICLFIKTEEGFKGKMRVYDRFFSKDYMILNITVKETFCSKTKKQIISCDISPKDFNHEVWSIFDEVNLKVDCN